MATLRQESHIHYDDKVRSFTPGIGDNLTFTFWDGGRETTAYGTLRDIIGDGTDKATIALVIETAEGTQEIRQVCLDRIESPST